MKKKTHTGKSALAKLIILAAVLLQPVVAGELTHYAFISGEVEAKLKFGHKTVSGSDGAKMLLQGTQKRVGFTIPKSFRFIPFVALSDSFAEINDVSLTLDSRAENIKQADKRSDMRALQDAADWQVANIEHGTNFWGDEGGTDGEDLGDKDFQIAEIENNTEDVVSLTEAMIEEGALEKEGHYDMFFVGFELTPHQDIVDAYAALVMSYNETDPLLLRQGIKRTIVRTLPIGTLRAGSTQKISASKTFSEQKVEDAKIEIYVYSGNGEPIATNVSTGLKPLSSEQLSKWRKLESRESL